MKKLRKNRIQQQNVYGLLRCQSIKLKCEIIHNTDKYAVWPQETSYAFYDAL